MGPIKSPPTPEVRLSLIHRFEHGEEVLRVLDDVIVTDRAVYRLDRMLVLPPLPGSMFPVAPPPAGGNPAPSSQEIGEPWDHQPSTTPNPARARKAALKEKRSPNEIVQKAYAALTPEPQPKPSRRRRRVQMAGWAEKTLRHRPRGLTAEQILAAVIAQGGPKVELEAVEAELLSLARAGFLTETSGRYRLSKRKAK